MQLKSFPFKKSSFALKVYMQKSIQFFVSLKDYRFLRKGDFLSWKIFTYLDKISKMVYIRQNYQIVMYGDFKNNRDLKF